MKLSGVPHLLRHSPVTVDDCRGMVKRQEYIPEDRTVGLPLQLNTWNYFQVTASGDLEAYPSYLTCKGQETRHGEKLVEDEVVLLELRVRVRNEMFLIHQGHIESVTEHLQWRRAVRRLPGGHGQVIYQREGAPDAPAERRWTCRVTRPWPWTIWVISSAGR